MRQIKFRVWDKASKSMMDLAEPAYREGFGQIIMYAPRPIENGFELMQFTGLLDKNGKEIYEGDVVRTEVAGLKEIVVWRQHLKSGRAPGFYLDCGDDECGACDFSFKGRNKHYAEVTDEVIGNIYENPELLCS